MSKSYAMTGFRCGWVIGPEPIIENMVHLATSTTYGVPAFIQDAAYFALKKGSEIEKKVAWLSNYIIHNANNLRNKDDELKVGGHQASCASVISILVVLYFQSILTNKRFASINFFGLTVCS